jgi:hypothetical protein
LNQFDAIVQPDKTVLLNWSTLSERDNDYFTIERSRFGMDWEEIIQVQGAGNSTVLNYYSTIDSAPFTGLSYYRLMQTDFNGVRTNNGIEAVFIESDAFKVFPNPAEDRITITGNARELNSIRIFNLLGQDITDVIRLVSSSETELILDLGELAAGMYAIQSANNMVKIVKK